MMKMTSEDADKCNDMIMSRQRNPGLIDDVSNGRDIWRNHHPRN